MSPIAPQLGHPLMELGSGYPAASVPMVAPTDIITLESPCFAISSLLNLTGGAASISALWAANKPMAFGFVLDEAFTVYQLGWINGNSPGGNADIGIYDASWNRKVSAGSTACAGAATWQFVDVADTALAPGSYYLAFNKDDAVASRLTGYSNSQFQTVMALAEAMDSGTSQFPLPDPLASMIVAAVATFAPVLAVALRAVV